MRRLRGRVCTVLLLLGAQLQGIEPSRAAADAPTARVEARSDSLLAVGITQGNQLSIHITRLVDNAAVRDAVVTVLLRGAVHPTVAEVDGGYTLQTADLALPGAATLEIQIAQGSLHQVLKGTLLQPAGKDHAAEGNSARQLWWWVLNFAVCIGFLMLMSRRRKAAARD